MTQRYEGKGEAQRRYYSPGLQKQIEKRALKFEGCMYKVLEEVFFFWLSGRVVIKGQVLRAGASYAMLILNFAFFCRRYSLCSFWWEKWQK